MNDPFRMMLDLLTMGLLGLGIVVAVLALIVWRIYRHRGPM